MPFDWSKSFIDLNNQRIEKSKCFVSQPTSNKTINCATFCCRISITILGHSRSPLFGAMELVHSYKIRIKNPESSPTAGISPAEQIAGQGLNPLLDALVTSGEFGCKSPILQD